MASVRPSGPERLRPGLVFAIPACQAAARARSECGLFQVSREHLGWVLEEFGPEGADHAVLLLPGALCTARFYDDLLAEPSINTAPIRFVATTLPGFGGTSPAGDLRMESYTKVASRLAGDLGCDVVVGHSLGAQRFCDSGTRAWVVFGERDDVGITADERELLEA